VWEQRQANSKALVQTATQKLSELSWRKSRVVDLLVDERIDQQMYEQQTQRLDDEIETAQQQLRDAEYEEMDVEALLNFVRGVIKHPSKLWLQSGLEQKQRLQKVFSPSGLTYSPEGFGTVPSSSFFNILSEFGEENSQLASPTGFEPLLPP